MFLCSKSKKGASTCVREECVKLLCVEKRYCGHNIDKIVWLANCSLFIHRRLKRRTKEKQHERLTTRWQHLLCELSYWLVYFLLFSFCVAWIAIFSFTLPFNGFNGLAIELCCYWQLWWWWLLLLLYFNDHYEIIHVTEGRWKHNKSEYQVFYANGKNLKPSAFHNFALTLFKRTIAWIVCMFVGVSFTLKDPILFVYLCHDALHISTCSHTDASNAHVHLTKQPNKKR